MPSRAPRRHEGAHVAAARVSPGSRARPAAEMLRQEHRGTAAHRARRPRRSSATSAARRRDAPASAPAPRRRRGGEWVGCGGSCCFAVQPAILSHCTRSHDTFSAATPTVIRRCASCRHDAYNDSAWPAASSTFWCRSRSTRPIRIGCRPSSTCTSATSSACRSARARPPAWSGRTTSSPGRGLHNRMKDVESKLDCAAAQAGAAQVRRLGRGLHAQSPRGMVLRMCLRMGEHLGPARERVGVRLAGPARSA